MPLSPSQLKTPNRPIGARNYMSYLERSFAFPVERSDEVEQWWALGAVNALFARGLRKHTSAGSPEGFMKAVAQGVVHLLPEQKVEHWKRVLAAGGKEWVSDGGTWMAQWSNDPQMLLWGLQEGYNPFRNAAESQSYGMSCWEKILRRLGSNEANAEEVRFFSQAHDSHFLATLNPQQLAEMFSLICWQARGHHQELLESVAQKVLAAGADPQRAFDAWAYRATEKTLPWSQWLIPQARPTEVGTQGLESLMTLPGGLACIESLWAQGVDPFPFHSFRSMGSQTTVVSSP